MVDIFYYWYVFVLEEYDEYVCILYNDVFVFYLIDNEIGSKINIVIIFNKKFLVSINIINDGNLNVNDCFKFNSYLY